MAASAIVLVLLRLNTHVVAQASTAGANATLDGRVTVSGSLRTRLESWDWFGSAADGTCTYSGSLVRIDLTQIRRKHDWQVEFAVPVLLNLPEQPIGAGPAGLGANYFVANGRSRNAVGLFVKQAFFQLKDLGGIEGQSLKIGRIEFFDGAEVSPKNETLAALKRDRVAARLLANFGFTHVQRSVDGVQYAIGRPRTNVTLLAARPTRGVFQVDGWGELNINVFYGAITRQFGHASQAGEWRLFGLAYDDHRGGVVKADNRPLAIRQADQQHMTVQTFGGHYMLALDSPRGPIDVLFWGAAQTGSWGALSHGAGSFAAEAGWQPTTTMAPWIRGGFDYASGDDNPNDSTHGTFFQVLPTPRQYARFPFFNLMNSADTFVELMLRPSTRANARLDIHSLQVANSHDLWYQGGGAFQPATFGYVGLPVNGRRGLATLYDASVDIVVTPRVSLSGYYGYAAGGPASAFSYATNNNAVLGYVELLIRF